MVSPRQNQPVYVISVAAELLGVHPRTLRIYEEKGFVRPFRTKKKTRLYSQLDIDRIKTICDLMGHGLNLAGVRAIMKLAEKMQRDIHEVMEDMDF
jgi:MerR family transcriptional regulator, heat shock protein HspR